MYANLVLRCPMMCCRVRPKSIEARLRAATCLCKLGCLAAADRLLDKVRRSCHSHEGVGH